LPEALGDGFKAKDWRYDMFYNLDGGALIAIGILLVEHLTEGRERGEAEPINEAKIDGPLDDYLSPGIKFNTGTKVRTHQKLKMRSLIDERNYYSRKQGKKNQLVYEGEGERDERIRIAREIE
jgi:hypothetical protein